MLDTGDYIETSAGKFKIDEKGMPQLVVFEEGQFGGKRGPISSFKWNKGESFILMVTVHDAQPGNHKVAVSVDKWNPSYSNKQVLSLEGNVVVEMLPHTLKA